MKSLTALSLSIAVLGGVATFLALTTNVFLIWAAFVAWAAFFALGGNTEALKNVIICGIFGAIMAWIAAIIIINFPIAEQIGLPLWAAIVVAVTVLILCLAANLPQLATIPASVLGYASTFAYLLQTPDQLSNEVLLTVALSNPLIIVSISIAVGAVFGLLSGKLSTKLTTDE